MTAATQAAPVEVRPGGRFSGLVRGVWGDASGRIGLIICALVVLVVVASAAGLLPYDPIAQHPADRLQSPSSAYWFGTDQFGRDVASRTFTGLMSSLRVAAVAVGLAAFFGALAGVTAGYFGRWVDAVIGRLADVLFAFPAILLALAVVAALGPGWLNTGIAIAVVFIPIFIRVSRGPVLSVRSSTYVEAGRVLGFSHTRLLFRHVLPNVLAPIIVQISLALSWAILTESALSFLGLGTQPPEPSLGLMVSDARNLVTTAWWTLAAPAVAIVVAVIGFNLLGDGLRSALDPAEDK
ncbi:MAG: ABC transporter permease [Streptosporangiales bacterium]